MLYVAGAKEHFFSLPYGQKLSKIKNMLKTLSKKSDFFDTLHQYFKKRKDINDAILDYLFGMVMWLIDEKQLKAILMDEKLGLQDLKMHIKK